MDATELYAAMDALLADMHAYYPKAAEAFSNEKLPNGPLLSWLAHKGYNVTPEPFMNQWGFEFRPVADPTTLTCLVIADTPNEAIREGIREIFLPIPFGRGLAILSPEGQP
ncbi:hypothetical protein [uncultured Deinococcus sp.]|uniref:hypothetical protein n=1 Tax=uncultured Deinococcus sp. TaxID=158789 RepID=UPI00374A6342